MRFLNSLLESFGVGMGTALTFVCCAVMGLIVITNWGFFWNFFTAFGDWIIAQLSKSPILANGTYISMIRKLKAAIKETRDVQSEAEGQKQDLLAEHHKNKIEYARAIERAKYLKHEGNEYEALSYSKKALKLQKRNKTIEEEEIPNLEATATAADRKIARLTDEIEELKSDRKSTNKTRRTALFLERANRTLLGDGTEKDEQILEHFREHVNSMKIRAQGMDSILANSPEEKEKSLDDQILAREAEEFLNTL